MDKNTIAQILTGVSGLVALAGAIAISFHGGDAPAALWVIAGGGATGAVTIPMGTK